MTTNFKINTNSKRTNPFDDIASLPTVAENQLPIDSAWLFPEYRFDQMDITEYESVIIERILEKGSWMQVRWLFSIYGEPKIAKWVRQHGFRALSKRSFALYRYVFKIENYVAPEWAIEAKAMDVW